MARERLRASGEAVEGSKKRIRRGWWEEVDILGVCWERAEGFCRWFWRSWCEVVCSGLLDDEWAWWREADERGAICGRTLGRWGRKRKCRVAREDMGCL